MNIVYLGSGQFGLHCLDAIAQSSHRISLVVTQPAHPAGRGRKLAHTPVADWAFEHSIPVIETADVNASETANWIAEHKPDLIVVVAFGQKISKEVVSIPPKGAINVHASLLPKYRGAAPINWAIVNDEKQTGITIITVAERMDAGEVLAQLGTAIGWDETAGELGERLSKMAAPFLVAIIDRLEAGAVVYTKQDESQVTRAPKLQKADGFLDFSEPAEVLRKKMLGFWPWPGACAIYQSKKTDKTERVIFAKAELIRMDNAEKLAPGTIDENLNVVCGENRLQITQLKPENSRLMKFADFVNGRHVCAGDRFIKIDAAE
jgi:methionyl-tRNA formyltransferase